MFLFRRDQEILRAELHFSPVGECAIEMNLPPNVSPRDQYKLFQAMYVTLIARLIYDAGQGQVSQQILALNRALFNDILEKEPIIAFEAGECLSMYQSLRLSNGINTIEEQHSIILKRRKDNSVYCDIRSTSTSSRLLRKYGPWLLVKYGEKQFGDRVYKDLSDALFRMDRFYRDMPYWHREGLFTVPRLTLGIMSR